MENKKELSVRDRILEAAREIFIKYGYVGAKTRHIANSAGTSEAGLFRLFPAKYALLIAVYDLAWKKVNEHIEKLLAEHGEFEDPRDELRSIIMGLWSFYDLDRRTSTLLIINTGNTDSLLVEHQDEATISDENVAYINRIEELCEKAGRRGLLKGLTPRAMAEGLLGLSEGIMLGWYLHDHGAIGRYPSKVSINEAEPILLKLLS